MVNSIIGKLTNIMFGFLSTIAVGVVCWLSFPVRFFKRASLDAPLIEGYEKGCPPPPPRLKQWLIAIARRASSGRDLSNIGLEMRGLVLAKKKPDSAKSGCYRQITTHTLFCEVHQVNP